MAGLCVTGVIRPPTTALQTDIERTAGPPAETRRAVYPPKTADFESKTCIDLRFLAHPPRQSTRCAQRIIKYRTRLSKSTQFDVYSTAEYLRNRLFETSTLNNTRVCVQLSCFFKERFCCCFSGSNRHQVHQRWAWAEPPYNIDEPHSP